MFITIKKCLNCGVAHEWDFDSPKLKEMRTIKKLTGLAGQDFADGMMEMDPDALTAVIYILHKRDKITIPFDDIDLDFNDFDMKETEEERQSREKLEAAESGESGKAESGKT